VLLRSDGHPLYNLSVVIDDIEMGINACHSRPGPLDQHAQANSALRSAGVPLPHFAHLPLILAPNKGKLSKRNTAKVVSLTTYRDRGFVPAAFPQLSGVAGDGPRRMARKFYLSTN